MKYIIYGSVTGITILFIVLGGIVHMGIIKIWKLMLIDFIMFALLAILSLGFYMHAQYTRIKKIEERLPDFLRDLAEAGRFGMTLAEAIKHAGKGKYGPLTPEIKRMASQIEWGVSATEVIKLFGERINTPLVKRVCAIVIKASSAGGNVSDILTIVSSDAKEGQILEKEKAVNMSTYLAVVYISFGVFIFAILMLNNVFLVQMEKVGEAPEAEGEGEGAETIEVQRVQTELIPEIRSIYLGAAVIHAVGDGILAGVIVSGRISSGMRHGFVMLLVSFIMLRVMG